MNDAVSFGPLPAGSPALRAIYDVIAADASERDAERIHPHEALTLLRRARFGALRLPVEEGGGGASLRGIIEEAVYLAEADSNVAHIYRNHFTFVERFLTGSHDKRRRLWRQTVLEGGIIGLASTELDRPQTGGAYPLKTVLVPVGDTLLLRGTKYYSTGSLYADLIVVRATSFDGAGVTVIVHSDRSGVELVDDWDGIGQRMTGTGTTNFNDVRVEQDEVILDRDNPDFLLPYTSTIAQIFVTAINAGIIRATLRDARSLVKSRARNFYYAPSAIAADDPILQQTIGRIAADAFAAELVVLGAAEALDRVANARLSSHELGEVTHDAAVAAAKAKVIVDELVLRSTTALFDVGGASAATRQKNLDRHWRNARTLSSHNPASYKAQAVGAFEVNGTRLPSSGFF